MASVLFSNPRSGAIGKGKARLLNFFKFQRKTALIALALFTVYVVWGGTYLGLDVALRVFPPLLLTGLRFAIAGVLLMAFGKARGDALPTKREWLNAAIFGTGMLGVTYALGSMAQQYISSSLAAILYTTEPISVVIFSMFVGHKTTRFEWIAIGTATLGIALLNLDGQLNAQPIGVALLLLSSANWGAWSVFGKKIRQPAGMAGYGAQMLGASLSMFALAALVEEPIPQTVSADGFLALVFLAIFGVMFAQVAYTWLVKNTRPAVAASYAYVNPIVAVGLGVLFAGDALTPITVLALGIVLLGVAFMVLNPKALLDKVAGWVTDGASGVAEWFSPRAHLRYARTHAREMAGVFASRTRLRR
ncbi:MAG TPA: EamA family transporter [Thermoflexales bacterium]|nr:EamA family transporter [Thermoflexales bacterium]HQW34638.1 EamA family transporter [Thermoflexales bacterium]HQZ23129.1 EamA family transporter [Thermoflexales bacterium]